MDFGKNFLENSDGDDHRHMGNFQKCKAFLSVNPRGLTLQTSDVSRNLVEMGGNRRNIDTCP